MFKKLTLHPVLIAAYAVLYLFSSNISEVLFSEMIRSLVAAIFLAIFSLLILRVFTKDWYKAALIDSVGLILFFSYGHVMDFARGFSIGPMLIGRTGVIASIWILVFIVSAWRIFSIPKVMEVSGLFNTIALFLLISPFYTTGNYLIQSEIARRSEVRTTDVSQIKVIEGKGPDIYYIILDMHGRADVHAALYGYDEAWFIDALKERGFYVAEQSTSNYSSTLPSVSSSLNMDYINYLEDTYGADSKSKEPYKLLLAQNKLFQVFRQKGYKIGTFETNFKYTEFPEDDVYLGPSSKETRQYQNFWTLNSFEGLLIRSTFLRTLYDMNIVPLETVQKKTIEGPYSVHRSVVLNIFNHLPDFAQEKERYFVFAHIVSPHPPYIFGRNGEAIKHKEAFSLGTPGRQDGGAEIVKAYVDQLHFIDTLTLQAIDQILANSKTPPIIVLQGDHGPYSYFGTNDVVKTNMQEQHGILNAYYFPDQNYDRLYSSITPVNSFRIILNTFFDENYELLPDKNYYHSHSETFHFIDVTDRVKTDPLAP
jgi:hypothetical protein